MAWTASHVSMGPVKYATLLVAVFCAPTSCSVFIHDECTGRLRPEPCFPTASSAGGSSETEKKSRPCGVDCFRLQYWAPYSALRIVQPPDIVQVKSLRTDGALNSAGSALLRQIPDIVQVGHRGAPQ